MQPLAYDYRVVWAFTLGYRGQWNDTRQWINIGPWRRTHVDARLDCKLHARALRASRELSFDPVVQLADGSHES